MHRYATELVEAVRRNQAVVLTGPTGCGKTTQLPQMLLRAGLTDLRIAVTQPRRIAAVSVAARIAKEQGVEVGAEVGYTIRFDDRTTHGTTRIQLMTDGILLQIARGSPDFDDYGVIVIDEAHERTLNIDFALGLLREALTRRADLRVVVSSATLRPETFVQFFEGVGARVPVVHVDARPFPVEVKWRPLAHGGLDDLVHAVAHEVTAIERSHEPGHVLAFLSGEEAIRRGGDAIHAAGLGPDVVVMPLFGAMRREEQERVFDAMPGRRKVILATNIAETSITIDGVRFVIDCGLAKVPRWNARTGILALREEGICQASAEQRAGRAGRTAPGTCIRLYSRDTFRQRAPFQEEEILRLDLCDVVLRLIDLGVHDVESFALPTAPPRGRIHAAIDQLQALGAIDRQRRLTPIGKKMVPFPLTPALARMVLEAAERHPDVVDDVLAYAAFLSGKAPFVFPDGQEDRARKVHGQFGHPLGDAVAAVRLVQGYEAAPDREAWCKRGYLDSGSLAFAVHVWLQLREIAESMGIAVQGGGDPNGIVQAIAAGFPQFILRAHGRWYEGPGDERLYLHPSSCLFDAVPRFVVATEIVVTQRPYARQVSLLRPAWVVAARPDLAEGWKLERERVQRQEGRPPAEAAPLQLAGVALDVSTRQGRPRVELDRTALAGLAEPEANRLALRELPPSARRFQARILLDGTAWLQGTPLATLLAMLPTLPLPPAGSVPVCEVAEGALLELDRNRHTLLRHLPTLLLPFVTGNGRRGGWLMLVGNGGGGWWFEVAADWREAVDVTVMALEALRDEAELDEEVVAAIDLALAHAQAVQERIHAAVAAAR
ncbi:MAG: ATP-dependent RNA helicase [Myxococcales bacterium]|nr:ATP-dependent RNA helicase [Myxococcales bacterium]